MQEKNKKTVKYIVESLLNYLNIKNIRQLAKYLGVSDQKIYGWIKNNRISDISLVLAKCPEISWEWLITGEGSMLLEHSSIRPACKERKQKRENKNKVIATSDRYQSKTAEASSHQKYEKYSVGNNFKKLCAANFDLVFDYIAEEYGTESIDIQMFLDDLMEVHHPFRVWLHEKKAERKNSKIGLQKNTSTA